MMNDFNKETAKIFDDLKAPEKYSLVSKEFTRNQIISIDKFLSHKNKKQGNFTGYNFMNEEKMYGKVFSKSLIPKKFDVNEFQLYLEKLKKHDEKIEREMEASRHPKTILNSTKFKRSLDFKSKDEPKKYSMLRSYEPNYNYIKRKIPSIIISPLTQREKEQKYEFEKEYNRTRPKKFTRLEDMVDENFEFKHPDNMKSDGNNNGKKLKKIKSLTNMSSSKFLVSSSTNYYNKERTVFTPENKLIKSLSLKSNLPLSSKSRNSLIKTESLLDKDSLALSRANFSSSQFPTFNKTGSLSLSKKNVSDLKDTAKLKSYKSKPDLNKLRKKTVRKNPNKCEISPIIIDAITFKKGGCSVDFKKTTQRESGTFGSNTTKNKSGNRVIISNPGVGTYDPNFDSIFVKKKTFNFDGQDISEFDRKQYLLKKLVSGRNSISGNEFKILRIIDKDIDL